MNSRQSWRGPAGVHWWRVANETFQDRVMRLYVRRFLRRAEWFASRWVSGSGETRPPGPLRLEWLRRYEAGVPVVQIAEGAVEVERAVRETIRTAVRRQIVSDHAAGAAEAKARATGEWRR